MNVKKKKKEIKNEYLNKFSSQTVSLAPKNIQTKDLTLVESDNNFTVFGWVALHKPDDEIVVRKTQISKKI